MTKEDIIAMVQEAIFACPNENPFDFQLKTLKQIEHFAALVAAAERERLLATDIHSCHANCERFACVQTRKAVEAEREACAKVLDEMADQMAADMEPSTAIAWVRNRAAHIRARGQE